MNKEKGSVSGELEATDQLNKEFIEDGLGYISHWISHNTSKDLKTAKERRDVEGFIVLVIRGKTDLEFRFVDLPFQINCFKSESSFKDRIKIITSKNFDVKKIKIDRDLNALRIITNNVISNVFGSRLKNNLNIFLRNKPNNIELIFKDKLYDDKRDLNGKKRDIDDIKERIGYPFILSLVELCGWKISIKSRALKKGIEIKLEIPTKD